MAGWGVSGPFKYGTAAQRAMLTAADVRLYEPFFETDTGKLYHVSTVSPIAWAPGHIQQYPIVEVGPSGATRRNWGPLTLAQAQALGEDDGAAVGDVAFATSGEGSIICDTAAASASTWKSAHFQEFTCGGDTVAAALRGLGWGSEVEDAIPGGGGQLRLYLGYAFRVESVTYCCEVAPGSTTIGIHKNDNAEPEDSDTRDPGGAYVPVTVALTADFAATDFVTVGITKTNAGGDVRAKIRTRPLYS